MDIVQPVGNNNPSTQLMIMSTSIPSTSRTPSRYENQKSRDWNTFCHYIQNHNPNNNNNNPLSSCPPSCNSSNVLEFLRYIDQFGKTKIHNQMCHFFGDPKPPGPCPCPLRQAWGSLDALVGRLRAAFEEHGGNPETNPFGARAVRLFLREVRCFQGKSRGISYDKKRKRTSTQKNNMKVTV